jgi:hypothetical protein
MALAARKQPSPPELVEQIRRELDVAGLRVQQAERARAQYAEASVSNPKAQADYRRADDDVRLAQGEVARLKLALASAEERARAVETERITKARAAQIERIEALAAERDQVGHELAAAVKILDEAFRKLIALAREITDALPLGAHDPAACLLSPGSITRALQHEIFRVGSRPHLLGGQDEPDALINLPGGLSPAIELVNAPDRITPFVKALAQASQYLSQIMRTGAAAPTNGGYVEQRVLSATEAKLADLHRRQADLASLTALSADQEKEYAEIVAEVARASAAVEAEKAGAQT